MGQKEFVKMIQLCRSRLNMAEFLQKLVSALKIGAAAGILIQLLSFAVPAVLCGLVCRTVTAAGGSDGSVYGIDKTKNHGAGGACDGQLWL
ncbi:MAG: hypothetical protein K2O99_08500 [Lachnospiraceae bacterium]|nr:hypothetical protein [Lachnospiraceae bacterium]